MFMKNLAIAVFLILLATNAFALSNEGLQAKSALQNATRDMNEMISAGFSVTRINDTINEARQIFDAQVALEEKTKNARYSGVLAKTQEAGRIKSLAFNASNDIKALEIAVADVKSKGIEPTDAESSLSQAKADFAAERYEEISASVQAGYEQLSKAQLSTSVLTAIYESSTRTITGFIEKNWQSILVALVALIALLIVFYRQIRIFLINSKIKNLETEREIVTTLIKKAQKDYFEKKTLAEGAYHIKVKRFSEIIRDINRQIPILKEELELIKQRRSKGLNEKTVQEKRQKAFQGKAWEKFVKAKASAKERGKAQIKGKRAKGSKGAR